MELTTETPPPPGSRERSGPRAKRFGFNPMRRLATLRSRQPEGALAPVRNALDPRRPKAQTRLWSSFAAALARPPRWSSLALALNIIGQLGLLAVTGKWPRQTSSKGTMRGVDFYPWKDFLFAFIRAAKYFKADNGYVPVLASPTTFNEHILMRKFFAPLPMPSLADKLAAKDYVKERVGEEFLPSVAWVGDDIGGLFAAEPPPGRYVLKANNGCDSNLYLNLPNDFSAKRREIEQWAMDRLSSRFGYDWGEWHYCNFKPLLFLEEFIDFNGVQTPDDYKFLCFRGKVCLIEVDVDRLTQLRSAFYTPDWKYIPVTYGEAPVRRARPSNLKDMVRVAEAIAAEMEFARVDLYSDMNARIKFGEITFAPGNAGLHFSDFKLDQWLGSYFSKGLPHNMPWDLENA